MQSLRENKYICANDRIPVSSIEYRSSSFYIQTTPY